MFSVVYVEGLCFYFLDTFIIYKSPYSDVRWKPETEVGLKIFKLLLFMYSQIWYGCPAIVAVPTLLLLLRMNLDYLSCNKSRKYKQTYISLVKFTL